jgi:hypothetical protein
VAVLELDVSAHLVATRFAGQLRRSREVGDRGDATRLCGHRQLAAWTELITRGGVDAEKSRRAGLVVHSLHLPTMIAGNKVSAN